jgi:DNA repair protein RadC
MERQLEFSFREETVSEEVIAPQGRDAVNELLNDPSKYASLKKVSLVYEGSLRDRPRITSAQDAKTFFAKYWLDNPGYDQERFVVACLDTKNRVQSVVVITIGTLDASLVHPREVFKPAILEGSRFVLLSHNHPSGDATPSPEDQKVTERLTEAGKILGIEVLDHIIHGDGTNDVQSLREG